MIVEFDSSSAHLKGPTEDLKNYKVLGIIDRVLLVLDMVSYQTYAIKVSLPEGSYLYVKVAT